ncbi:MAG TPA: AMP-binding protein [Bryobacteraceae bacterium]|nr:AMP-binding protein [Bryobacteraceae bacterium]
MRDHLATLLDDFRRCDSEIAVVRFHGNRRRVTTYGEIARLAGRFAALLVQRGINQGDRVLIWAENSAEWIAAFHGCLLRGVLAVPLDANGTAEFAARVAADVNPSLAIGDTALISQLPVGIPRMVFDDWAAALPAQEAGPIPGLAAETPLEILFTSGTTGDPKGIVLTHGNVLASFRPIEQGAQPYLRYERLIHPLRILHTLPLSHVFGQTMGLWVPSIFRAELHFENRLVAPRLVETIRRERISVLAAVPRVHALLKTHLESTVPGLAERVAEMGANAKSANVLKRWWRFRDVHHVLGFKFWALISGGGALPGTLEAFWNSVGLVVVQGYGMTETTALITLNHPFHVAQGTIGKPLPGREVKLGPDGEVLVRGDAISHATWSGGALHPRTNEWLATGDLAQTEPTGELRFLGRKSEVIVTAAGLNLHPEDLEAAIEQEPGVAACAVVPMETIDGPEPIAVLAMRGQGGQNGHAAAAVIEHANTRLAEFQRLRRWVVWPEPDLPRTSTGKIRRKVVAAGLARLQAAAGSNGYHRNGNGDGNGNGAKAVSSDWLLTLIAQIAGETPLGGGDELHLTEDLHLDSLGRVQLAAAIEERTGISAENRLWDQVQTVGDLRRLLASDPEPAQSVTTPRAPSFPRPSGERAGDREPQPGLARQATDAASSAPKFRGEKTEKAAENYADFVLPAPPPQGSYVYPHWPWWLPFRWLRAAFIESIMRPLVWLLGNPRVVATAPLIAAEPMLIVANHVTSFDGPLLEYALPGPVRRRIAVAMSGEMLEDYRHFRDADRLTVEARFYPPGPLIYLLLTALFNVFPLPKQRDFQRSFAHAGEALDRGMHVMLFPEGTRSEGALARFRPGIGLLVKQSSSPVLPMAIRGLGELKKADRGWFRSGTVEVRIGEPMRFSPTESEASITARLRAAVEKLLTA